MSADTDVSAASFVTVVAPVEVIFTDFGQLDGFVLGLGPWFETHLTVGWLIMQ